MADEDKKLTESGVLDIITRIDLEESLALEEELSTLSTTNASIDEDTFEELYEKYKAFAEFRR